MDPVSDLMTPDPLKVSDAARVAEARSAMTAAGARHLPVVGDDGRLLGILTDYALDLTAPDAPARSAMVRVPSCVVDTPIPEALARLVATTMDCVVVVDREHRPVGLLTEHDVVRVAPALLEGVVREVVRAAGPVASVGPDTSFADALARMADAEVRHLPVVANGEVVGVISMRDLLGIGAARGREGRVGSLITGPAHTLPEGATYARAATRMATEKVGCLPLLDVDGALVGMITRSDVIRTVLAVLVSPRKGA